MSGTYSTSLTNPQESYLGGVSQIPSIMLCNPNQSTPYNQTSLGINNQNNIIDRDSGKPIVIQLSSDFMIFNSFISFRTDLQNSSPNRFMLFLKCLLIIKSLPESALEEAVEELEGISSFYASRVTQVKLPRTPIVNIKGVLKATQVRPPITLEP